MKVVTIGEDKAHMPIRKSEQIFIDTRNFEVTLEPRIREMWIFASWNGEIQLTFDYIRRIE